MRSRWYRAKTTADNTDDVALLSNTPAQAESLLVLAKKFVSPVNQIKQTLCILNKTVTLMWGLASLTEISVVPFPLLVTDWLLTFSKNPHVWPLLEATPWVPVIDPLSVTKSRNRFTDVESCLLHYSCILCKYFWDLEKTFPLTEKNRLKKTT